MTLDGLAAHAVTAQADLVHARDPHLIAGACEDHVRRHIK